MKRALDRKAAMLLNRTEKEVAEITRMFISVLAERIIQGGPVSVAGLGKFHLMFYRAGSVENLRPRSGGTYSVTDPVFYRVGFTKSGRLKALISAQYGRSTIKSQDPPGEQMDKFAVDENVDQEALEKQAAAGCPNCHSKVEKHGSVLICPKCGSEPFEAHK